MASRLGDQTARMEGRITLNPASHVDPIGTLLFPAMMIFGPLIGLSMFSGMLVGWAKPTPVITRNFRKIVRDDNLTTLAGPVSNLLMVLAAVIVLIITAKMIPDGRSVVLASFFATLHPVADFTPQPLVLVCTAAHAEARQLHRRVARDQTFRKRGQGYGKLIVEQGSAPGESASFWLTMARIRPFAGSMTTAVPFMSPRASIAAWRTTGSSPAVTSPAPISPCANELAVKRS